MMNTRSVHRNLLASSGLKTMPLHAFGDMQEPGMRIGGEYQVPVLDFNEEEIESKGPGAMLLWKPSKLLTDSEIDSYVKVAKDQYNYTSDQALGMLFFHNYDINTAMEDLPNFCPLQEDWSMEDKVTFEQAFRCHGKNFQRIRSMLPDKPISSLVKYYYLWKRTYSQYSLLDKHSRRNGRKISNGLPPSNEDDDSINSGSTRSEGPPIVPPVQLVGKGKQLPKGIYMSTNELSNLASEGGSNVLKQLDKEILELKETIQSNKQMLSELHDDIGINDTDIESLRPSNYSQRLLVPAKWSEEELAIAVQTISEHGKNIEALSQALPGKSSAQCRNFFTNYKHKLNLPRLIAEYELKHGYKVSRYSRQAAEQLRYEQQESLQQQQQYQYATVHSQLPPGEEEEEEEEEEGSNEEYHHVHKRPHMIEFDLVGDEYM